MAIRVVLVDDQPEIVERLRVALTDEFTVVGTAHSGEELLLRAPKLAPDVVVLDVSMPGMSGIEAAARVKSTIPEVKVVMLSMHSDPLYVSEALKAGASAYVLKERGTAELMEAIRAAWASERYLSPTLRESE